MIQSSWFHFVVALFIGLLMGLERERSKGEGPQRGPAGIRTFGLAALAGAIGLNLAGAAGLVAVTICIGALAVASHVFSRRDDPGLTTEVALLLAPLCGGLAMSDPVLAAGAGVAVTILLAAKDPLHAFVKNVLTRQEIQDGLLLAVATVIVWPQLPDRPFGPFNALNPNKLWLMVILVLAIGALGHVATRALGARFGLPLAGLASGFVSSTATIGSMGGRAAAHPNALAGAVAGATLSTVSTFLQMSILLFAISPPTLLALAPALAAGGAVAAAYGVAFTLAAIGAVNESGEHSGKAVSLRAAFALTAALAVMVVAAATLKHYVGDAGVIVGAALAGLVDTHAAAISVASLAASGSLSAAQAVTPILAAMTCNALAKMVMAVSAGTGSFSLRVIPGIVASMAAAWIAALI